MAFIATLRATNCSRLLSISERVVAACGSKTAYVFRYNGDQVEEASCAAPRDADVFAPWLPPGAPISTARAVYSVRKDGGYAVLVQSAENTTTAAAPALEVIASVPEKVEEMRIFYQSILTLQTASAVYFYFLDPSTAAATLMGSCALPAWSDSRDTRVEVTSSECWAAAAEKMICVMCLSPERLYVAVVVCTSLTSAKVVRRTAEAGVPLPTCGAAASVKVLGWTVRWGRQELVLLLQEQGAEKRRQLASFSLQMSGSSAWHQQLDRWTSAESVAASLGGATDAALQAATDVCSDGDGTHVWLCDTVTGPAVILHEVACPSQGEVVLNGTNANARLTVARGVLGMFVLAGRSLYLVRGNNTTFATHSGRSKATLSSCVEKGVSSTTSSSKEGRTSMPGAAAAAVVEVEEKATETTMSDWLQRQGAEPKKPPQPEPTERQQQQQSAVKQSKPQKSLSTSVVTSSSSHIKEKLLQYVFGISPSAPYVVRDAVYVSEADSAQYCPRHAVLAAIAEKFHNDASQQALAALRYAAVAQSLHPYTVLELLRLQRFLREPETGHLLAMATLLAEKSTLQHGGLQRLPNFASVSAAFFRTPGGPFTSELEKKQYTADLCVCAMAALANGGLGATRLLFAVADRAVSVLYGGRVDTHRDFSATSAAAEQACEATIAESVSLTRSFVEWSLTASSSLGLMSAHVGTPQMLTKEAALRSGTAHPIDTSRQVEIRPLQVTRLPKKSL
jgi:hypothetical protein